MQKKLRDVNLVAGERPAVGFSNYMGSKKGSMICTSFNAPDDG